MSSHVRAARRRFRRLILESLESRAMLAHCGPFDLGDGLGAKFIGDGVTTFTEDFSDNPNHEDPATVGGALDVCEAQGERLFTHLPSPASPVPVGILDLPPAPAHFFVLLVGRGATREIEFRGTHPDYEVAGISIDWVTDGVAQLEFVGAGGTIVMPPEDDFHFWETAVTTRGAIIPGTQQELGSIQSIRVTSFTAFQTAIDNITVLIAPKEVNDPPVALDDWATTARETPLLIDVLNNDFDADGDPLTLSLPVTTTLRGGQVELFGEQVLYTPPAGYPAAADQTVESRTDRFSYAASDDHGHTITASVDVFVNTPPAVPGTFLIRPRSAASFAGVLSEGSDADGDAVTLELVSLPGRGQLLLNVVTRSFEYFPDDPNDPLDDVFTYLVRDSFGAASHVAEARIRVANQAPLASGFSRVAQHGEDGPLEGSLGSDPDGDGLQIELVPFDHDGDPQTPDVTGPQHGTLTFFADGRFAYDQLAPDYIHWASGREVLNDRRLRGSDRFAYRLRDHAATSSPATMDLVVSNQPPVTEFWKNVGTVLPDADAFVLPTESITVSAPGVLWDDVDLEGDPLTAVLVDGPDHGALVLRPDGSFTYVPQVEFAGQDGFRYRASDGFAESPVTQVSLLIGDQAPITAPDFYLPVLTDFERNITREFSSPHSLLSNDYLGGDELEAFDIAGGVGLSAGEDGALIGIPNVDIDDQLSHPPTAGQFVFEECFVGTRKFAYGLRVFVSSLSERYWSNFALVTIRSTDLDTDGDGAMDSEDGLCMPHSFAHRDAQVALVNNAVDGRSVSLSIFDPLNVNRLRNVAATDNPAPVPPPAGASFPLGFFQFEVHNLAPGAAEVVNLTLPSGVVANTYWKFGREPADNPATAINEQTTEHWYDFLFDGTTGAQILAPVEGVQRIVLHLVDGGRGDDDLAANGVIVDPGAPAIAAVPRVSQIVVNDGSPQRSMITSLTIHFNQFVSIERGAFELRRQGARQAIDLKVALSETDGHTVARLTFKGAAIVGGSLADGAYRLTIRGEKVHSATGLSLDGDGDGTAGGDYMDEFFRRFGDTDGDGDVDQSDKDVLKSAFGKRRGTARYLWYLDFNSNGRIWAEDLAMFYIRYRRGPRGR